ncbi:MAG: hypothetical protein M3R13_11130 [Armatimonadota bacterium]|nr:hypothetical protein [Armatimonadota bacterium]
MNQPPDWGAYLAGAMGDEERNKLDALLATDEQAQQELEGFRSFIGSVRKAGQAEDVPVERLEASLGAIASETGKRSSRLFAFAMTAVIAVAVAWLGFRALTFDPMGLNKTPTIEQIAVESPESAMRWVRKKIPLNAPSIDLAEDARIVGARYGDGWACYDYEAGGESYYLYMSRATDPVKKGEPDNLDGTTVYRGKGIGWISDNVAYYIRGGEDQTRDRLAKRALAATEQ